MGIKVKTKVNFNEIIEKLHKVAKDFAEKKSNGKVDLENIAFDDQNGKFLGGGEFAIFMKQKEGTVSENDKGKFLDIIKEYVHYFVGEEESKYVDEDSLQPIYLDSTTGKEEVEEIKRKKEEQEREEQENIEKQKNNLTKPAGSPLDESIFIKNNDRKLMNLLFEADDNAETDEKPDNEQDQKANCIGYGIAYSIESNGKKDWSIAKAISNKAKGLFGGIAADLLNIKIKIGGEPVNLGHVLDPKKWLEQLGMKDIDASQVASDMKKAFDNDFKHNEAQISVEDNEYLKSSLNRMTKNSPEFRKKMEEGKGLFSGLMSKLKKCKYSVLIQVKENDPWYPKYNTDSIAKTASKAFGTTYNVVDWNKVSKDDVIKIDNAESIKPQKKEWDPERALGDFVKKYHTEMNKDQDEDKKKTRKMNENENENNAVVTKDEYLVGLQNNMEEKQSQKQNYSYDIKKIEEIVKFLKDGNYEGNIKEIQKYDMGCLIHNGGLNETIQLLRKVHSDTNGGKTEDIEKAKKLDSQYGDILKKLGYKSIYKYIQDSDADTLEDVEQELQRKSNKKDDEFKNTQDKNNNEKGFDINRFSDITNDILKRYEITEIPGIYQFKKIKVAAESIYKKDWRELLVEKMFESNLIFESAGNKGRGVGKDIDNYPMQLKTEQPLAIYKGGQIVPNEEHQLIPIENQDVVLVMPFNIPDETKIKKIDKEQLQIDYKDGGNNDQNSQKETRQKIDWYIIPHRGIKDKGDRNMQRSTDSHGVTTTSTSNKEYKPKGK